MLERIELAYHFRSQSWADAREADAWHRVGRYRKDADRSRCCGDREIRIKGSIREGRPDRLVTWSAFRKRGRERSVDDASAFLDGIGIIHEKRD